MKRQYIFAFLILILASSCSKDNNENNIPGKWKVVSWYNGGLGGSGLWQSAPGNEFLEFSGKAEFKQSWISSTQVCKGTYDMPSNDNLLIYASCFSGGTSYEVEFIKMDTLILTYGGMCGPVKTKLARVKGEIESK